MPYVFFVTFFGGFILPYTVQKEFEFIRANEKMIMKNASVLYNQKTKADTLYKNKPAPKYLSSTVDFLYAEQRCQCFIDEIIKKIVTED